MLCEGGVEVAYGQGGNWKVPGKRINKGAWSTAVSYTHLDVYKRQVLIHHQRLKNSSVTTSLNIKSYTKRHLKNIVHKHSDVADVSAHSILVSDVLHSLLEFSCYLLLCWGCLLYTSRCV